MATKDELTGALDHSRQVMRDLLRDLQSAHGEGGEVYPTWTVRELLAHLTGWDETSAAALRAHAQGQKPATPAARGFDPFNAENVRARQDRSLEQVIADWEAAREDFKQAIRNLPEEKAAEPFTSTWGPVVTLDVFVRIFAEHEIEHAQEARANILGSRG